MSDPPQDSIIWTPSSKGGGQETAILLQAGVQKAENEVVLTGRELVFAFSVLVTENLWAILMSWELFIPAKSSSFQSLSVLIQGQLRDKSEL